MMLGVMLFLAVVSPPVYIDTDHNDVGGDAPSGSGVPPVYIDTDHNDVGGDALSGSGVPPPLYISIQIIMMLGVMLIMPSAYSSLIVQGFRDGGSKSYKPPIS
jgi:hypothetical protein